MSTNTKTLDAWLPRCKTKHYTGFDTNRHFVVHIHFTVPVPVKSCNQKKLFKVFMGMYIKEEDINEKNKEQFTNLSENYKKWQNFRNHLHFANCELLTGMLQECLVKTI